jgi:hypothetical protein
VVTRAGQGAGTNNKRKVKGNGREVIRKRAGRLRRGEKAGMSRAPPSFHPGGKSMPGCASTSSGFGRRGRGEASDHPVPPRAFEMRAHVRETRQVVRERKPRRRRPLADRKNLTPCPFPPKKRPPGARCPPPPGRTLPASAL